MSLVFTMPGKIGDALLQWPVVHWYCTQNHKKATLWLDEGALKPLVNLFATQPCIEAVELKPGITGYQMGGQPWDFGLSTKDHVEHEIYHLGMRKFPSRQITLETLENVPLQIQRQDDMGSLMVVVHPPAANRRLVLHGNFTSHATGVPSFWRFLSDHEEELAELFDEVVFVGTPRELQRARELYPSWGAFSDGGDFLHLASFIAGAEAVIGCGSSIVALAGCLRIPSLRIHDAIGDSPKVIWSNLGAKQFNLTEEELRTEWSNVRDAFTHVAV